ncbi:radical SAM protein [Xylanibacter rarus]|uniref:radical SAM protein n=1 Tax=Xylanibacter rarus TaxID=1676614 RepID=UPI003FEF22D9
MKLSKYTLFHKHENKIYIYHQVSNALFEIDNELVNALNAPNLPSEIPDDILSSLKNGGFIIDDNTDETCNIRYANLVNRYNSKLMRVTILPTINCNFRCWYCYEHHKASKMTEENADSVFKFITTETQKKNIEKIVLDWFGGEPLLRFKSIIYPLSKRLKSWCEKNNIAFVNIMTTNGSLITDDMAIKMNEIGLNQMQITLDGDKKHHNQVRYSSAIKNSYDLIVKNIHTLCKTLDNPYIELRINYTKDNIDSTFDILDSFEKEIRRYIFVSPHIVWQDANNRYSLKGKIDRLKKLAYNKGYGINQCTLAHRCSSCYIDNMEQFVINYDLNVYKCTAREFNEKFCIGKITNDGVFIPNEIYYKYYITPSPFMRKKCIECELLPSCLYMQSCLQKSIEGFSTDCDKNIIQKSIDEDISYKIQRMQ